MALSPDILKLQKTYRSGEVIFSEEDLSRDLYVLLKGEVEVIQKGITLTKLEKAGIFFGEMALLTGQPRTATLRSSGESQMLQVSPEMLPTLMKGMPDLAMRMAKNLASTVSNLNKELLKSWEAVELSKLLKEEMGSDPNGTLADVLPRLSQEVEQNRHDQQLEVAESYLRSEVFSLPFVHSIELVLKPFVDAPLKVALDQGGDSSDMQRFAGVDFSGAASGAFIFMGTDGAMENIGEKLFGEEVRLEMERDALLELSRRVIEEVRKRVPGLHMELSSPEALESFSVSEDDFLGLKLKTDVGFKAWIYLNR